jgi:hypothetical protein
MYNFFLLIFPKDAQKKQRFFDWDPSNTINDSYRMGTPSPSCKTLKKSFSVMVLLVCVMVLGIYFSTPGLMAQADQEHKPLEYDVSVKALLVPFIAVDASGKPVYDLSDDELDLYINEDLTKIIYLNRMVFRDAEISAEKEMQPPEDVEKMLLKKKTRLVFIVVDAIFNSAPGLKRSKTIARKLIENCAPQDRIVLLEIQMGGLKYIAGPEPGGKPFLEHLKKLKKNPYRILRWSQSKYDRSAKEGYDEIRWERRTAVDKASKEIVKMWLDAFHQYKNALQTLDEPKVTFLFTEDYLGELREETFMVIEFRRIQEYMKKQIHEGGSVLEKVHVGGLRKRHIIPTVARLHRSTAVYYELFFNPGPKAGEKMNIVIKCKRPGVRINAVGYKGKDKPYQKLGKTLKKVFAVNVACGRSWNRLIGRLHQTSYQKMKREKIANETRIVVNVPIPTEMRNKKVDIFVLRFDDQYQDVDVALEKRMVKDRETITLQSKKEKKYLYFVIIEPNTTYCIFNKVL